MFLSEVSLRYAKALHEVALERGTQDKVGLELQSIAKLIKEDADIRKYLNSPVVSRSAKEQVLRKALQAGEVCAETESFLVALAQKDRLQILDEIVEAFQNSRDEANGVTRGTVQSASVLTLEEREEIQKIVEQAIQKKVILSYEESEELIGGVIARVGSYVFDDTLTSHMKKLNDNLTRRTH